MSTTLRPACPGDLETILAWVTSPDQMRLWAGPAVPFPGSPAATWEALSATPENAFALTGPSGDMLGFGQILARPASAHLARIIVSPAQRGQGLGRRLCSELVRLTTIRHPSTPITLNVYEGNAPALALYQSLGFQALPADSTADPGIIRMSLQPKPPASPVGSG